MSCSICNESGSGSTFDLELLVPLYKSGQHIEKLFERVNSIAEKLSFSTQLHLVFDGYDAAAFQEVLLHKEKLAVPLKITQLSRNFGVGPALMAGMSSSNSCMTLCFGSDLQEPETLFVEFTKVLTEEPIDLVLGHRISRDDPMISRLGASFYWWIVKRFINPSIPRGGFDVFGISAKARTVLSEMTEKNTNITSQITWIGFRQKFINFERSSRITGKSSWTFGRKLRLFFDSIYGFTTLPITAITSLGLFTSILFLVTIIVTLSGSILGLIDVPGYVTLLLVSAFGSSVSILSIGVVGNYVVRVFENTKQRPTFVISEIRNYK